MDMPLNFLEIHEYFKVPVPTDAGAYFLEFRFTDALSNPRREDRIRIPILGPRASTDDDRKLTELVKDRSVRMSGVWVVEDRTAWLKPNPNRGATGGFGRPIVGGVNPPVTSEPPAIPRDGMGPEFEK